MNNIYLDNNATTKTVDEVNQTIIESMNYYGNPSSNHELGQISRDYIFSAKESIRKLLNCANGEIIFTSSGTESNNTIFRSLTDQPKTNIVTSRIEHSSIVKYCEYLENFGYEVRYVPTNQDGIIDTNNINKVIDDNTSLVSIQWVNNETGVIQPIEEIISICKQKKVPFHTDASQAVGKLAIDLDSKDIDYLTFTGHKIHAPKGIGVIYIKEGRKLDNYFWGGSQENSKRAGTENILGVIGLGKACDIRRSRLNEHIAKMTKLRDLFEDYIINNINDVKVNGNIDTRICNTSNILFRGIDGQALIASLSAEGLYCSQSSACTNMSPEPSYVLTNMGLSYEEAFSSVRFSFSILNSIEEIEKAVDLITFNVNKLKKYSALWSVNS